MSDCYLICVYHPKAKTQYTTVTCVYENYGMVSWSPGLQMLIPTTLTQSYISNLKNEAVAKIANVKWK